MKILFISNDGGGFADYIEVQPGTTANGLFAEKVGGNPSNYMIRVNRSPAMAEQRLEEGDRVTFTPVKIEGALTA